jgi:hypothetical protein
MTKLAMERVDVAFIFSGTPSPTTPYATRSQSAVATWSDLYRIQVRPGSHGSVVDRNRRLFCVYR